VRDRHWTPLYPSRTDVALAVADGGAEATNRATPHEHISDFTLIGDSPAMAVWKPTDLRNNPPAWRRPVDMRQGQLEPRMC
jgi:transketolase C-terminal domain/subunit